MQFSENEKEYVVQFMRRTLKNLKAINDLHDQGKEVYEVTQLVNSSVGMLTYPKEILKANFSDSFVSSELLEKIRKSVVSDYPKESVTSLQNIVRHFRNAVSHGRVTFPRQTEGELQEVCFCDEDEQGHHFSLKLSLKDYEELVISIAKGTIKKYEKRERKKEK